MPGLTPPIAAALAAVDTQIAGGEYFLEQYRHSSRYVPSLPDARELFTGLDAGETPLLEWIARLGGRFRDDFTFDSQATSISTPLGDVLKSRRGVCQDFAHLFIACARLLGLPAAYVSGYILTSPPPGQPRMRGADAMHAWASVFVPGTGWVVDRQLGIRRHQPCRDRTRSDYADVAPIIWRGRARSILASPSSLKHRLGGSVGQGLALSLTLTRCSHARSALSSGVLSASSSSTKAHYHRGVPARR
jgi:transglutaminase-like putative cysteine protease